MASYRRRSAHYWRLIGLQLLSIVIGWGIGLLILSESHTMVATVPISSLVIGILIGSVIASIGYVEKIEIMYDKIPSFLIGLLAGMSTYVVLRMATAEFFAGIAFGFGAGVLVTMVVAEISIRM